MLPRTAVLAIAFVAGCGRHAQSLGRAPIAASSSVSHGPRFDVYELPQLARVERYCVAMTTCRDVLDFGPKGPPPPGDAFALCVREVVRTIATTKLADRSFHWLDECGDGVRDCGALYTCGMATGVSPRRCYGNPAPYCMLVRKDGDTGPAAPNTIVECPSRFVSLTTDCATLGMSCRSQITGYAYCTKREKCEPDTATWSCRGRDRVRCSDGVVAFEPCEGDRTCVVGNGTAACVSLDAPCPASTECEGAVGESCADGAVRRIRCGGEWTCDRARTTGALPCRIPTTSPCDPAAPARCLGDDIEYCAFGALRRVSCPKLVGTRCDATSVAGAVCALH